jgi:hypothetical protein
MPPKKKARPRRRPPRRPVNRYALDLDDGELELLTDAICPESVARKCWELLRWRREGHRNAARLVRSGTRSPR